MTQSLIMNFHPGLDRSRVNKALLNSVSELTDTDIVNVRSEYPDGIFDPVSQGAIEAERLLGYDRIVFQYPFQWYSVPGIMKDWLDVVLTRMFYMNDGIEGEKLKGTPLKLAVTAGSTLEAYSRTGQNYFTMAELLAPLSAVAYRCGFELADPYILHGTNEMTDSEIQVAIPEYRTAITSFVA